MGGRLRLVQEMEPGSADGRTPGVGAGVWLLLGGIVLSCTGVGAVVGIPLIIVGLAMPRAHRSRAGAGARPGGIEGDEDLGEPASPATSRGAGAGTASWGR